MKIENVQG